MTTSVNIVKREQPSFVKTAVQVDDQSVLALNPSFQDPLTATASKPGIVEYQECNMKLSSVGFAPGSRIPTESEIAFAHSSSEEIRLLVMISTKAVEQNAELVCFYEESGLPPLKRAKSK